MERGAVAQGEKPLTQQQTAGSAASAPADASLPRRTRLAQGGRDLGIEQMECRQCRLRPPPPREVLIEVPDAQAGRLPMHNVVPRLSATPGALRRPAPVLGEHNAELLRGLGYDAAEIASLSEAGVLGS